MLQILDTGTASAESNMRFDEKLLSELGQTANPLLHLYRWEGLSATYGYFIDPKNHLDLDRARERGLSLARRPTGGGIIFHIWDLAFSFLLPASHPRFSLNTLENYRFVNEAVLETVREYFRLDETARLTPEDAIAQEADCRHFCMAKPTQYDVVYQGMKIAGSAQRRMRQGYLHQGSISLAAPEIDLLKDVLLSKEAVLNAMLDYAFTPVGSGGDLGKTRDELQNLLADKLRSRLE